MATEIKEVIIFHGSSQCSPARNIGNALTHKEQALMKGCH